MGTFDSYTIEIEHTASTWTDYTSRLRMPVDVGYGRPNLFDRTKAGIFNCSLDNYDGDLMPDLIGATHYPYIIEDKRIRWKVTRGGTTWTRFLGWIVTIDPQFPDESLANAYVNIVAVDALGKMALKKLRSNWTEQARSRGKSLGVQYDVYESLGATIELFLFLTQQSDNTSAPSSISVSVSESPPLSTGSDDILATGPTVEGKPDSAHHHWALESGISSSSQCIQFLYKAPDAVPDTTNVFSVIGFLNSSITSIANLGIKDNSGSNGLSLWNADNTTSLGFVRNMSYGHWHVVTVIQNATTASHSDVTVYRIHDGNSATASDLNFDIRNVAYIQIPGYQGQTLAASWSGLMAIKDRSKQSEFHGYKSGNTTLSERMDSLESACSDLPISITKVGTWTALSCTGNWLGRTALDVGNEICLSNRESTTGSTGLLFARPKDSEVLAISGSATYPATPLVSATWDGELLQGLKTTRSIDANPTRVTVAGPQTTVTSIDTDAESNGRYKEFTLNTISRSGYSDAADIADWYLARNTGLRIEKVRLDLCGAVNDMTADLFDESGTNTGLFPTAKIRIEDMPTTHFTFPTRDVHVEGWTEHYDEGEAYILADTSQAPVTTLASEVFTGSNGSAWNAQWVTGATASGATVDIQSNRGRILPGSAAYAYTARRLDITAVKDGHFHGSFIPQASDSYAYMWVRADSTLGVSGYAIFTTMTGDIYLVKRVASVQTVLATYSKTLSAATQYGWRIWIVGSDIYARTWTWGLDEQKTWDLTATDSAITSAGYFGLGARNGAAASAQRVDFDDVELDDAGSRA